MSKPLKTGVGKILDVITIKTRHMFLKVDSDICSNIISGTVMQAITKLGRLVAH